MNNDYQNPAFKKLLQKLQEESWQLELIISGFAIFGLFTAFEPLSKWAEAAQFKRQLLPTIVLMIAIISCAILLFNLVLHVILRGLWIGTLGLRYVSGDIDYETLNYSEKFTKYLKKKVGSFDKYISTLENYCSIMFAVSYLLIFYVLALTFSVLTIALIDNFIIENESLPKKLRDIVGLSLIIFVIIGMLASFFDFITQGWLKKKKWTSIIYFPIYRVFSIITLSFLYRPLVYNFLDNKFGKRLSFILLPVYITILIIVSLKYQTSNYFTSVGNSKDFIATKGHYLDLLTDKNDFIDNVAISSKVINTSYINIFMLFNDNVENGVFNYNPSLKPKEDKRGIRSDVIIISDENWMSKDSLKKVYIRTFNEMHFMRIDSIDYDTEFILSENNFDDMGFEAYMSIKSLEEGRHFFEVFRKQIKKGDTITRSVAKIPFWYFKD